MDFELVLRRPIETARITGHLGSSTHFSDKRVNQDLAEPLPSFFESDLT